MQQQHQAPEQRTALFAALADAEAALHALQEAGAPYPAIRMHSYAAAELAGTPVEQRAAQAQISENFWALTVTLDAAWRDKALAALAAHRPFAVGSLPTGDNRANDTERGAIAWRHYVFETGAATDAVGDGAGTTGTTGVISSGVFADNALATGNPPVRSQPASDQRPSDAGDEPTSDTRQPEVAQHRSRPQTELK